MSDYLSFLSFEGLAMFTPYPTSIAPETWKIALDALRGQLPDPRTGAHAVWDTTGFALGKVYPDDQTPLFSTAPCSPMDRAEVEKCLEILASPGVKAGALPWGKILVTLAQLLATILAGG